MKLKNLFTILLFLSTTMLSVAQISDDDFTKPLIDVLDDLQESYQVRFKYNVQDFENYELKYADWRLVPGDLEASLKAVLAPFDHIYVKQDQRTYKLKPFQYHLVTSEEGSAALDYYTTLYSNKEEWESRKAELRSCFIEALGLNGLPVVANPTTVISKIRKYAGYTVENIGLETIPGYYVTGSIYKPEKIKGRVPVILSPNGHFGDGRYNKDIQTRAAGLAKMGAVVVTYDLFGWGESAQEVGSQSHRKSIAQTIQINNGLKLLDYLLAQKYADPSRVGITGGSGGGSQTMLIAAIEDRIKVSVPTVMTSSFHSGGCPCESGMGIHLCGGKTNNAEVAAMFAPKPMMIISDGGDWTFQVPEVEYPFIKRTYEFYGADDQVENAHFAREKHDYGPSKRNAMYEFMASKLGLDLSAIQSGGKIDESGITVEEQELLYVFGNQAINFPQNAVLNYDELMNKLNQ
ncbi:S9 family peptidase [Marinoscillum sp. MHG1-6]|uniref:alpha/beta hydrolase family protein n=1 Tax=Marinoscillum sp. MHG1-6 TaxID=2959627 RepID=UPI0021589CDA|nr:prolyl oligopeptidase family serine peptidase [Marinoscillum sp. MHG1-6]